MANYRSQWDLNLFRKTTDRSANMLMVFGKTLYYCLLILELFNLTISFDEPKGHESDANDVRGGNILNNEIKVRRYQDGDTKHIAHLYYNTIHTVNATDYTKEQLDAWAPSSLVQDYCRWQEKLEKIKPFVALIGDIIVGFAEFESNGHIDCFYVHHAFQSAGIGSALMFEVEKEAADKSISRIYAEVSITAKPFFEAKGFKVVKQQTVQPRGVELINFVMEKQV